MMSLVVTVFHKPIGIYMVFNIRHLYFVHAFCFFNLFATAFKLNCIVNITLLVALYVRITCLPIWHNTIQCLRLLLLFLFGTFTSL